MAEPMAGMDCEYSGRRKRWLHLGSEDGAALKCPILCVPERFSPEGHVIFATTAGVSAEMQAVCALNVIALEAAQ